MSAAGSVVRDTLNTHVVTSAADGGVWCLHINIIVHVIIVHVIIIICEGFIQYKILSGETILNTFTHTHTGTHTHESID